MSDPAADADSLLELPALTAAFKKGQTMLGNHWRLFDAGGRPVGRTRRVYEGVSGKVGKRLAVVTGLSTAGSATVEIVAADGEVVGSVFGQGGHRTTAMLSDATGSVVGSATHEYEVAVTLKDAAGTPVAIVETPPDDDQPAKQLFPVRDVAGRQIAALARDPHAFGGQSILGDIVWGYFEEANYEAELLRHYGFRRSNRYTVALLEGVELDDSLRTLTIMLPVLAGHLY
jgi:hypothetical protein